MKLNADKILRIFRKVHLPNGRQAVLIEAPTDGSWPMSECSFNIYCIDSSGEIVWQVRAPISKFNNDSFTNLVLDGEVLKASRFFGTEFRIDMESGIAEEVGWHK